GLESQRRLDRGIELYQRGLAPVLVLLGPGAEGGPTEAEVRAAQARLHGIPADAILTETRARTTREEAMRVKALLQSRGARTVLLVTNAGTPGGWGAVFGPGGFEGACVASEPPGESGAPGARLDQAGVVVKELLGLVF